MSIEAVIPAGPPPAEPPVDDQPTVADVLDNLLAACAHLRKASEALAAARAANTIAIARLSDVERQATQLLAAISNPTPGGTQ